MRYEPAMSTLAAALLAALGTAIPFPSQAALIVVTDMGDVGSPSTCTLRQAIASMGAGAVGGTGCTNSGAAFGNGDTINFDTVAFPDGSANNTIMLASGALVIGAHYLTIDAAANGNVTIDAHQASRVMTAYPLELNLNYLSLINGTASGEICGVMTDVGGGICSYSGTLTLTHSTVSGNSAEFSGGGIYSLHVSLTNSTLTGNSAVSGTGGGIRSRGVITLTDSTVSGNSAGVAGGGIFNQQGANITGSTLSGNSADSGGGIYGGAVSLTNSTLTGNSAVNGLGGGIYSQLVTLTNSTLSGNSASTDGGGIFARGGIVTGSTLSGNSADRSGGGIYNAQGDLTLTNSTLSGNSAHSTSVFGGGGISMAGPGSLTLTNATISANDAALYGSAGGIFATESALITADNSILAGNTVAGTIMGQDVRPRINYGLDDLIGGDPKLGPLGNNGGPTQTMLPLPGSPAIDNGSDVLCGASPVDGVDQRGIARPQGARCDIGAVETDTIFANGFE